MKPLEGLRSMTIKPAGKNSYNSSIMLCIFFIQIKVLMIICGEGDTDSYLLTYFTG